MDQKHHNFMKYLYIDTNTDFFLSFEFTNFKILKQLESRKKM